MTTENYGDSWEEHRNDRIWVKLGDLGLTVHLEWDSQRSLSE